MTASIQTKVVAKIQGDFLLEARHLWSLSDIAQRFFKSRQTLQDFHQPLHGLIRRLKRFLQSQKEFNRSLSVFVQRFFGLHQRTKIVLFNYRIPPLTIFFTAAIFPYNLSAQTPAVSNILSTAQTSWDGIQTYDATFYCYYPFRKATNDYREAWSKTDGDIVFYRFETLNPMKVAGLPYLQIRNSSGTWEMASNGIYNRAFNVEYERQTPFNPDFKIPANQTFIPDVAEDKVGDVSCFVITTKEFSNPEGLGAPLRTSYYIGKTDHMVHAEVGKDSSGEIFKKSIITSLKINSTLDDSLFTIPAGLSKIVVTNMEQRFSYMLDNIKTAAVVKESVELPGAAGRRISIRSLILAGLFLSTLATIIFVCKTYKSKNNVKNF